MNFLLIAMTATLTFIVAAWLTKRFSRPDSSIYFLDYPNERSLHLQPIPRGGGVAIIASAAGGCLVITWQYQDYAFLGPLLGVVLISTISFVDDRRSVNPFYRLLAQILAALIAIYAGYYISKLYFPGFETGLSFAAGLVISFFFIIWMTNLYNFMDGMDGLAGGMSVFGFGVFAALGWMANAYSFFAFSLIIAMASMGFLILNFPPARIFMGDTGSSTLGFLAAVLSLWGSRSGIFPIWIALLVFSPFLVDASVTLIRRLLQGEAVWRPHKTHFYQKLVQAGWSHRKTVLIEYIIMFGCAVTALYCVHASITVQAAALASWLLFYIFFCVFVSWYYSKHRK